jgi:hypothetical protein
MLLRNTAGGVYLFAWDTVANVPKTGDQANITGFWSLDGSAETSGFTTAHPTQIGHGIYWQPVTATECNGNAFSYSWVSSTTGIAIDPVAGFTGPTNAIRRNVAYNNFQFPMLSSADSVTRVSGATVTLTRNIDGGAFAAAANAVSEIGTTGIYAVNLAATDLNGAVVNLLAKATGCDDYLVEIFTQP